MRTVKVLFIGILFGLASSGWAQSAKWTFMVYMAADNDLEPFSISDFNEMETVGSSADLQIIVQYDRSPEYDATNGNWTDTRRFRVTQDANTSTISSPVVQNMGELNMGDPQTLVDFVTWARQNYPAEHYCLVLWDHGGGWKRTRLASDGLRGTPTAFPSGGARLSDLLNARKADPSGPAVRFTNPFRSGWGPGKDVCLDQTNSDRLQSDEISGALQRLGGGIDVLGYDACLMAMIENAYEVRGKVNYMVGSEETEPGDGWAYDLILPELRSRPTMTPAELSTVLVQKYGQYYGATPETDQTLSAVDMSKLDAVIVAINNFAQAVTGANAWSLVSQARQASDSYNQSQNIDLYDFADRLGTLVAGVGTQANALKTALSAFVISNYAEPSHGNARGVAVYFPPSSGYDPRYANGVLNIDFTADTQWDEMIQASYQGGGGGEPNADPYEPNDSPAQAYGPVTSGFQYIGYITSRNDRDFFKIVAGSTFDLRIDLTVPADYDIYLWRKSGEQYQLVDSSANMNTQAELIQRSGLPSGEYYVAVMYLWNNDNYSANPYQLTIAQTGGGGVVDVLLQYDDGHPNGWIYSNRWDINEGVACYFVPPVTPAVLKGFYFDLVSLDAFPSDGGSDGSFYVFGADYYGTFLPDTLRYIRPGGTGWNSVDLTADNITLFGDFFAGLLWDRWNSPAIGWDTNSTNGLNLVFTEIGGYQDWFLGEGTFFIRAAVSYLNEVTGVTEDVLLAPTRFSLSQNYPNPFNPATNIEYDVPSAGHVTLAVYNIMGREVAKLVDETQPPGHKTVSFNGKGFASGVYFYTLRTGTFSDTKKLILIR